MKILDLGAHDAFVTTWVAQQLAGQNGSLQIDALELMPQAAEIAQRRLEEVAPGSRVVCGDALDAPTHFEPGTYDAVVAYELIEHVPDPQALLEVCEQMLKPEGRVYVSTPNGTFGAGNNPHHLRTYRIHDLTDALRRRGNLVDADVGQDGIATVSYTPAPRKDEIAIYCGPGWEKWAAVDIELKGLGGSETAAVRLGEQLSDLGYIVTIYGEVEPGQYRDLAFRHWSIFDPMDRRLAVISSRMPQIFDRPLAARTRMLWMHDTDCGPLLTERRAERIDHILTLSKWHLSHVRGLYPFAAKKVNRIRNGIEGAYFTREYDEPLERLQRVVYTSSPDRGLDVLLDLWPHVLERVPGALFGHAYSAVYDAVAQQKPEVAEHRAKIQKLAKQPGVHSFGSLSQPDVARLMRASLVWAHPSWAMPYNVPFHEVSCIGAMEAQAAGCLVVASGWGALPETVRVGRLVNGEALSDRWKDAFVAHIVEGLTDESVQEWAQREGPKAAQIFTWKHVAQRVVDLIEAEVRA